MRPLSLRPTAEHNVRKRLISIPVLAWCAIGIGIALAFTLGWFGPVGFWATAGLLFADVFVGLGLTYALYYVGQYCIESLKWCPQTNDHTVWSFADPLIFVPGYWLATLLAKMIRPRAVPGNERSAS